MKKCSKCKKLKENSDFTKKQKDGESLRSQCKECEREYSRLYDTRTKNKVSKKYEKTINGFIMRVYRNMKSRVLGIQKQKFHLYENLELLDKDLFYEWSKNNIDFLTLFKNWENNKYVRKLTPSIDRIDSKKGYVFNNIRWVIFSDNCKNIQRLQSNNTSSYRGVYFNKSNNRWVSQISHDKKHYFLGYFENIEDAIETYNKKAIELFGKFAFINIKKIEN